jgi:hypothetical protein
MHEIYTRSDSYHSRDAADIEPILGKTSQGLRPVIVLTKGTKYPTRYVQVNPKGYGDQRRIKEREQEILRGAAISIQWLGVIRRFTPVGS